jgi:AraC-like DNA-binding protein
VVVWGRPEYYGGMSLPDRQKTSPTRQSFGPWATLAKHHPAGTELAAHQHRSGQLVYAIAGVMLVDTPSARWTVPPQRALWVPPGHPHRIHMLTDVQMRTVYCLPGLVSRIDGFDRRHEVHAVVASSLIRELVQALFDASFSDAMRYQMVCLLLQALQQVPALPTQLPMPASDALRAALSLLLEANRWRLPMSELASAANLSERTFTRRFTAELGMSFRAWRQRARVLSSLDMLSSGRSIKAIAHTLDFASSAAYVAAFRELLGCTPNAFRLRGDENPPTALPVD